RLVALGPDTRQLLLPGHGPAPAGESAGRRVAGQGDRAPRQGSGHAASGPEPGVRFLATSRRRGRAAPGGGGTDPGEEVGEPGDPRAEGLKRQSRLAIPARSGGAAAGERENNNSPPA